MSQKKKMILLVIATIVLMLIIIFLIGRSFGFFKYTKEGEKVNVITINGIEVEIVNPEVDSLNLENAYPVDDSEGLTYEPFIFTMTNTSSKALNYSILVENDEDKQADCVIDGNIICPELSTDYIRYSYKKDDETFSEPMTLADSGNVIANGVINGNETVTSSIILWISSEAGNEIMNHYFFGKIIVTGAQNTSSNYEETLLNGADPVLTDNLVPITIADDGTVTKANTQEEWYSYGKKKWANAVILKDESITYENNETIPEDNIESYFVWIPKYSYQLWDLGDYSSLTTIDSTKPHTIPINFGLTNTSDSNTGECTTPGTAGASGNCQVGDYMTHPSFLAFDSNGFWVGKFETGYDGATSTTEAEVNSIDTSKIIVKPNVYSWRNITIGNAFKNSYDYLRNQDSHMMKNTEWGAVVYLQHSAYGSATSVRFNNNGAFITGYAATEEPIKGYNNGTSIEGNRNELTALGVDGTYTVNYLNPISVVASTTGNMSGVYDMSGGTWEYVMAYTTGASTVGGESEITSLYHNFFSDSTYTKYWDKYTIIVNTNFNNRILGDATGEMGPFGNQTDLDNVSRQKTSWYEDRASFLDSSIPWLLRSGHWSNGTSSGTFAFDSNTGGERMSRGFRIILTPIK